MSQIASIDPDLNYFQSFDDCSYEDLTSISTKLSNSKSINILHVNIRSINKYRDELLVYLNSMKVNFSVLILSETWLNSEDTWLDIPGFKAYHSIRDGNKKGGGVSILIDVNIASQIIPHLSANNEHYESISVEIECSNKKHKVTGVYRPPSSSLLMFNETFFEMFTDEDKRGSLIIAGDFNIDILSTSHNNQENNFFDELRALHLMPLINLPTRITPTSQTCIDHIYINSLDPCKYGVLSVEIADHCPVFCSLKDIIEPKQSDITVKFRDTSQANLDLFKTKFLEATRDFSNYDILNVNDKFHILDKILLNTYNSCCPIKTKKITAKKYSTPWLTNALKACTREKHRLYKLSLENSEFIPRYKRYKNTLVNSIRLAKANYYQNKFDRCINDSKSTWKVINKILKPNSKKKDNFSIEIDGEMNSNPEQIAEEFNKHFSSVAPKLAEKIPSVNVDPTSYLTRQQNTFVFFNTDCSEINKIINSFKSKPSHINTVPSFAFKHISSILSPILTTLINESVTAGVFPDCLKIARVIPIYKSGKKNYVKNYRPISTLPFLSKIIERLMHSRVVSFFSKFNLFYGDQFGFLKHKSTCDAILKFTDKCYTTLNDREIMLSVFLDFSKAFDTIDHSILIKKLELYGIRGNVNNWFKSYLTNRKQYVLINNSTSNESSIKLGVPQGSILGPLLFLIYINDMHRSSSLSHFIHFADDSTVLLKGKDINELTNRTNCELEKIETWLNANRLSLNIEKTAFSVYSNKKSLEVPPVKIRNHNISLVSTVKFLGINIDNKLLFKNHTANVCRKISRSYSILYKLSQFLPQSILKKLYYSMIYPFMIYGIEVWGNSCKTEIKRLEKIQIKCIKLLSVTGNSEHLDFISLKMFKYTDIYKYFVLKRTYMYINSSNVNYFKLKFNNILPDHTYVTRNSLTNAFQIPQINLSIMYKSFFYNAIKFWNQLPVTIKSQPSARRFEKHLKSSLLS